MTKPTAGGCPGPGDHLIAQGLLAPGAGHEGGGQRASAAVHQERRALRLLLQQCGAPRARVLPPTSGPGGQSARGHFQVPLRVRTAGQRRPGAAGDVSRRVRLR
ncbi:hypothetical protein ON010_g7624 [Phytophthora cinnamomi]|nr:hypothetical protein ON010_g7624 [Phytophthora cinnamomi]